MIAAYDTDWFGGWRPSDRRDLPGRADVLGARDAVDDAIEATGKGAKRSGGELPPHVMAYFVYLLTHYAVSALICKAATAAGIDPDRVKFKRTVRIIRRRAADPAFSP
jgi:hypothetical protein